MNIKKILSPAEFKKAIQDKSYNPEKQVVKMNIPVRVEKAVSENNKEILYVIASTSNIDRDGDTIAVTGWEFDNYIKNPVVLWAHDGWNPPIGRAVNISITNKQELAMGIEFLNRQIYPDGFSEELIHEHIKFAEMTYYMYKSGFINAFSVSFIPKEWKFRDDDGIDFLKQELTELSCVSVPANPEALVISDYNPETRSIIDNYNFEKMRLKQLIDRELKEASELKESTTDEKNEGINSDTDINESTDKEVEENNLETTDVGTEENIESDVEENNLETTDVNESEENNLETTTDDTQLETEENNLEKDVDDNVTDEEDSVAENDDVVIVIEDEEDEEKQLDDDDIIIELSDIDIKGLKNAISFAIWDISRRR